MKIYVNIIWAAVGFIVALFGLGIWKGKFKSIADKINSYGFSNPDGFGEFFGKAVIFLGAVTLASAVICINSPNYIPVSLTLNALTAIYFVLESFHLKKKYR